MRFIKTWLSNHIYTNKIISHGYNVFRKDRNGRGGGVLLAFKDTISFKKLLTPSELLIRVAVSALCSWWLLMPRREISWLEKFPIDGPGKLDRITGSSTSSNRLISSCVWFIILCNGVSGS